MLAPFSPAQFYECLGPGVLGRELHYHPEIPSTNDAARAAAKDGAAHGTVFLADYQSAGRGRRGNAWSAPAGQNLLFSVVLRPSMAMENWPRLTHAAAWALLQSLDTLGADATVKWPNDVYLEGKKVAGILLETSGNAVVMGIGINVLGTARDFPPELRQTLTTLEDTCGPSVRREAVLATVLRSLETCLAGVENRFDALLHSLWQRSFLRQKNIRLDYHGETHTGLASGHSPRGGLLLTLPSGEVREFLTADLVRPL